MIETTAEGFKILVGKDGVKQFMFDSERIDACISYIRHHDLRSIGINSFIGYKSRDIEFLRELKDFVEGLSIPENHFNLSVVNELRRLTFLGFADDKKTTIDLSNFPNLSILACEYTPRLRSLEACEQLRSLTLKGYKDSRKNLSLIPLLPSLEELSLFVTAITSLDGIERFKRLKKLILFRALHLQQIDRLSELKATLDSVEFDQCKKIEKYEVLGDLTELEKLIVSDSHPIESLKFLNSLEKLKFLSFVGTTVTDGDLSPAAGIAYVGFDEKNHYSHSFDELSAQQGNLRGHPGTG